MKVENGVKKPTIKDFDPRSPHGKEYLPDPSSQGNIGNASKKESEEHYKKWGKNTGDRGFHHSNMHKAAEETRMADGGSHDPVYEDKHKNK